MPRLSRILKRLGFLISTSALAASSNTNSSFNKYLTKLALSELNPPVVPTYNDLAFIAIPFIVIATIICALIPGKKAKGIIGDGPRSPNVTTLPDSAPIPKRSISTQPTVNDERNRDERNTRASVEMEVVGRPSILPETTELEPVNVNTAEPIEV